MVQIPNLEVDEEVFGLAKQSLARTRQRLLMMEIREMTLQYLQISSSVSDRTEWILYTDPSLLHARRCKFQCLKYHLMSVLKSDDAVSFDTLYFPAHPAWRAIVTFAMHSTVRHTAMATAVGCLDWPPSHRQVPLWLLSETATRAQNDRSRSRLWSDDGS